MYGQYKFAVELSETIRDISRILTSIKGREVTYDQAREACTHYKQLALICACAFMMSPSGQILKNDPVKQVVLRNMLVKEIGNVYPKFASEEDEWWGYDTVMAVVTEMANNFITDIISLKPDLRGVVGLPHLFIFIPSHIDETVTSNSTSFTIHCRPPAGHKLLGTG